MTDGSSVAFCEGGLCELDGGEQAGDGREVGGAAFKTCGRLEGLIEVSAVGAGASEEQRLQQLLVFRSAGEEADALGPSESLMGGGSQEVHTEAGEGAWPVSDGLCRIEQHEGTVGVGDFGEFLHVLNASGDIGRMGEHDESGGELLQQLSEVVVVERSGIGIEGEVMNGDVAGLL